MTNTVSIRYMLTGEIFQKFIYNDFGELYDKLRLIIINHDSNMLITLFINDEILNDFDILNISLLKKLDKYNDILVIFSDKRTMYCSGNENGKYMLDWKEDKYSMLLATFIDYYKNTSHSIIINSSYKELVLLTVNKDGLALQFTDIPAQNDKEILLEAVKQNGYALRYSSSDLRNDKEIVLEAVTNNGRALQFANFRFENDEQIILAAVRQNGLALEFASSNLKNNKKIILEALKQNITASRFIGTDLKNDKDIIHLLNNNK